MVRSLRLEEAVHAREVGRAHEITLLEPVLPLARLLGQDVRVVRVEALELPRPGPLEPLHGGALGLLLRHLLVPRLANRRTGGQAEDSADSPSPRSRRSRPPVRLSDGPPYFGAMTIVILRPSSFASASILPTSARLAATRSSTALPSSRCAICRRRYIMVTLTLFPSPRNSRACRVLKSKS